MDKYTDFGKFIYSEEHQHGKIGRGTHFSIFRTITWNNNDLPAKPMNQDLSIIWDEDHDERIMQLLKKLYVNSFSSNILFIGERKAVASIIVTDELSVKKLQTVINNDKTFYEIEGDNWEIEITSIEKINESNIINDESNKVETYLRNIMNLWELGIKNIP